MVLHWTTVGFVDGTIRPVCKPKHNQRAVYNGHKRVHALRFQSVVAANETIANLLGLLRVEDFIIKISDLIIYQPLKNKSIKAMYIIAKLLNILTLPYTTLTHNKI